MLKKLATLSFLMFLAIESSICNAANVNDLIRIAQQCSWQVPFNEEKLERHENVDLNSSEWKQFIELVKKAREERRAAEVQLVVKVKSSASDAEIKDLINAFVLDSRKKAQGFLDESTAIIDPLQLKEAFSKAAQENSSWMYDPLLNKYARVKDATFVKIQDMQMIRLNKLLDESLKRNASEMDEKEMTKYLFDVAVEQIRNSAQYFNAIDKSSRMEVLDLIFGSKDGKAALGAVESFRSNLKSSFKDPKMVKEIDSAVDSLAAAIN